MVIGFECPKCGFENECECSGIETLDENSGLDFSVECENCQNKSEMAVFCSFINGSGRYEFELEVGDEN